MRDLLLVRFFVPWRGLLKGVQEMVPGSEPAAGQFGDFLRLPGLQRVRIEYVRLVRIQRQQLLDRRNLAGRDCDLGLLVPIGLGVADQIIPDAVYSGWLVFLTVPVVPACSRPLTRRPWPEEAWRN